MDQPLGKLQHQPRQLVQLRPPSCHSSRGGGRSIQHIPGDVHSHNSPDQHSQDHARNSRIHRDERHSLEKVGVGMVIVIWRQTELTETVIVKPGVSLWVSLSISLETVRYPDQVEVKDLSNYICVVTNIIKLYN